MKPIHNNFNTRLCEDFLCGRNKRPLFGVMWEPTLLPPESLNIIGEKKTLKPDDIDEVELSVMAQNILEASHAWRQDMPFSVQPGGALQWMEAICGCEIVAANGQIWAQSNNKEHLDLLISGNISEMWMNKLFDCTKRLSEDLGSKWFNSVPVLHGPLDILYAIMGGEEVVYCMYDEPELFNKAISAAASAFLRVSKKLASILKPVSGGYCSRMHIYTKKPCVTLQNDATYLTSPEMYKEFILQSEKNIVTGLPQTVYHAHNSSFHILEEISEHNSTVLQITVDTNGPPIKEQIEVYRRVKEKLPIVLSCWNFNDLERFMEELTPEGLSLTFIPAPDGCKINSQGTFDEILEWNERYDGYIKYWSGRNSM